MSSPSFLAHLDATGADLGVAVLALLYAAPCSVEELATFSVGRTRAYVVNLLTDQRCPPVEVLARAFTLAVTEYEPFINRPRFTACTQLVDRLTAPDHSAEKLRTLLFTGCPN